MPRYRIVGSPTFINSMLDVGEAVEYAGWPGSTLEPDDGDTVARKIKDFYVDQRKRGRKIPRVPNLADFADKPAEPQKAAATPVASATPVKDE